MSKTILIVEDEPAIREMVESALHSAGFATALASMPVRAADFKVPGM